MRRLLPAIAVALACAPVPSALAADGSSWCGAHAPPCIVSATRDGAPVAPTDPDYDVGVTRFAGGGSHDALWDVTRPGTADPYELGAAELGVHWTVTIDTGAAVPRVASQYADAVDVTRTQKPNGTWRVTVAGKPVTFEDNEECDVSKYPWTCPFKASAERRATLQGQVTDYGSWDDVAQREAMLGMNYSTDVAVTSIPPEIEDDPATGGQRLLLRLANQHQRPNGQVFQGFVHLRIPKGFLKLVYGIDDPGSLTTGGIVTSGAGGGSASVTQDGPSGAILVDVTGLTFSQRVLRIRRGKVIPTKPTKVRAERTSRHGARLRFRRSKARGSKVTSYVARCAAKHASAEGSATKAPIKLGQLEPDVSYRCRVRARSRVGAGPWSKRVTLPAKPG